MFIGLTSLISLRYQEKERVRNPDREKETEKTRPRKKISRIHKYIVVYGGRMKF